MGKQNLYDHSMRVPLLMRRPGIAAGVRGERLTQLFDLVEDPWEMRDLAGDLPEVVARLREALVRWQGTVDDPILGFHAGAEVLRSSGLSGR